MEEEPPEQEELDWWSKYYASLEEIERKVRGRFTQTSRCGGSEGAHLKRVDPAEEKKLPFAPESLSFF